MLWEASKKTGFYGGLQNWNLMEKYTLMKYD